MRSLRILACGGRAAAAAAIGLTAAQADPPLSSTTTPIKHVVVIFGENVSFDHYFGTYPYAANPAGEPVFHAAPGTPSVNGLTDELLTAAHGATPAATGGVENGTVIGIGDQSFDARAGTLLNMFDFGPGEHAKRVFPDPTSGEVVHGEG